MGFTHYANQYSKRSKLATSMPKELSKQTPFYLVLHCVKSGRIRCYSGPHFPVFSPNAGKCGLE